MMRVKGLYNLTIESIRLTLQKVVIRKRSWLSPCYNTYYTTIYNTTQVNNGVKENLKSFNMRIRGITCLGQIRGYLMNMFNKLGE